MASSTDRAGLPTAPIGVGGTLAVFGATAVLLYGVTGLALPGLAGSTGIEPVLLWFSVAGLGFFPAILAGALWLLRSEGVPREDLWRRLRFSRMSGSDWGWTLGGLAAISAASVAILVVVTAVTKTPLAQPWFLEMEPVGPGRYWLLGVWLPFFGMAILVEEIAWRGVVLPRQEAALGRWAWAANGAGWLVMHAAFGIQILAMLLPIVVVLPFVALRTRNSWPGVLIHAAFNGPGFLVGAFGLV